jgi:hypothetical protein
VPVNQFVQARIDLSKKQSEVIGKMMVDNLGPMVALEETNIPNCVAYITASKTYLVHHDGTVHDLGAAVAQAKSARQPSRGRVR